MVDARPLHGCTRRWPATANARAILCVSCNDSSAQKVAAHPSACLSICLYVTRIRPFLAHRPPPPAWLCMTLSGQAATPLKRKPADMPPSSRVPWGPTGIFRDTAGPLFDDKMRSPAMMPAMPCSTCNLHASHPPVLSVRCASVALTFTRTRILKPLTITTPHPLLKPTPDRTSTWRALISPVSICNCAHYRLPPLCE